MRAPTLVPATRLTRNIFFFENFQNADMGDAASKAAAQSQTDARKAAPALARTGLTGRVRRPVRNE